MKRLYVFQCYSLFLSCLLFTTQLVSQTTDVMAEQNQAPEIQRYICLDDSMSMIRKVISDMSQFDTDLDSPLHLLKNYLKSGYVIGLHDEIKAVLEYADWFARQQKEVLQNKALCAQFEDVVNQFLKGDLDITEEEVMRSPHLSLLLIDKRILVKGKAIFENVVIMEKKLRVHDRVRFYDDVHFEKDVKINGTLSVQDEIVGCDLTVGCNINMNNSTSAAVGNINKAGQSFIHNFGTNNTFMGVDAGNFTLTGTDNVGVGANALSSNTLGTANTAVGSQALPANTEGRANVAIGVDALQSNTTGNANVAVGASALAHNITGNANTAVGSSAMQSNTTGNANTGLGVTALQSNTIGNANTGVGASALQANTTGINNTAAGANTLQSNTTGVNNTAVGSSALADNVIGSHNTALGFNALVANTIGSQNVAIGNATGLALTGSSISNTFVGFQAGGSLTSGNNNLYLGSNSGFAGVESNVTRIGNLLTASTIISGIFGTTVGATNSPVIIDNTGQLGTVVSSAVFKNNIKKIGIASDRIYDLNPVQFTYKKDATNTPQYGLIAEEVAQVFPELVINDAEGKPFTVRYEMLSVLLLNELKKLAAEVAVLKRAQAHQ